MSTIRRIAKNAVILLIAQGVSYLLSFFYIVYAARYLGPTNYGVLVFAIAFTGVFGVLADFGLLQMTVLEIARKRDIATKYITNVSLIRIVLGIISYGLVVLIINLMGYPPDTRLMVYLVGVSVIFNSFSQLFFSIFQAYEKMEFQAVGQILQSSIIFGGVVLVIQQKLELIYFGYVFITASLLLLIYGVVITKLIFSHSVAVLPAVYTGMDWLYCKKIFIESVPFGLIALCSVAYYSIDSVIISYTQGDSAVGYYGAAYKIMLALLFIPSVWSLSVFPVMVKLHVTAQESLLFAVERSIKYLSIIAFPMAVGLTLLANQVIRMTFGAAYMESAIVLQIIVWAMAILFITAGFSVFLLSINKQTIYTIILAVGTGLNVVLNIIFIPKYSYVAASIILLITSLLLLGLLYFTCKQFNNAFSGKTMIMNSLKIILSGAIMGVFVYYFQNCHMVLLIPAAIIIYSAIIWVVRTIDDKDVLLFRSLAQ